MWKIYTVQTWQNFTCKEWQLIKTVQKKVVIKSVIWKFMERGSAQIIQFFVSIVLARLLAPQDFGIIALVLIFTSIANIFVQSGLSTSLIQKRDADDLDFSSVFYFSLAIAAILYAVLFATAPAIACFYNRSDLTPVIRILSCTLFFGALSSVQEAYVARNMLFKKLFYRSILATLPAGCISVILAFKGLGVWALVTQQLVSNFLICILMWLTIEWRPRWIFSFHRIKSLFSFGWKLLASSLLDSFYTNLHSLVIGKIFKPEALGFYNRGSQFPSLVINNIDTSIQAVLLPSLSSIQDDREQLKRIMRRAIKTSSFIVFPLLSCLAVCSQSLVEIMLGAKWLPCVPFIQICCITYAFWPIHTSNLSAINAIGRSDVFLKLEIIKKAIGITILILMIVLWRSAISVAISGAITSIVCCFVNTYPNKKFISYGLDEQLQDILPYLFLSLGISGIAYTFTFLSLPTWALLLMQIVFCTFGYAFTVKLLKIECFEYLWKAFRGAKFA